MKSTIKLALLRFPVTRAMWATAVILRWLILSVFALFRSAPSQLGRVSRALTPNKQLRGRKDADTLRILKARWKRYRRGEIRFGQMIGTRLGQLKGDVPARVAARELYLRSLRELTERGEKVSAMRRRQIVGALNAPVRQIRAAGEEHVRRTKPNRALERSEARRRLAANPETQAVAA